MGKNRTVDIEVKPNASKPNGYEFGLNEDGKGVSELVFNKTVDKMKKAENYEVTFKLHNKEGADLVFSKLPAKVLWAKQIDKPSDPCPDSACYMNDVFFVNPQAAIKDHELSVINVDQDKELFAFALNFLPKGETEGPTTKYTCYDPIGNNQNGGEPFIAPETIGASIVGGAVIGAAAAYLATNQAATATTIGLGAAIGALAVLVAVMVLRRPGRESLQSGSPA